MTERICWCDRSGMISYGGAFRPGLQFNSCVYYYCSGGGGGDGGGWVLAGIAAITSNAAETLASKCRELEFIDLAFCFNVTDATLTEIAEHCSMLEKLCVYGCNDVTAVGLTEIAAKCSKLKTVFCKYLLAASLKRMFSRVSWLY
jgi:hypothetical protein